VHGAANQPPSHALTSLQSTLLVNWLNQVAGIKPAEPAPPQDLPTADESWEEDSGFDSLEADTKPLPKAASTPKFKPRDAFDPEIFNRRHAKRAFSGVPASISEK
jgi:hypothetical protein